MYLSSLTFPWIQENITYSNVNLDTWQVTWIKISSCHTCQTVLGVPVWMMLKTTSSISMFVHFSFELTNAIMEKLKESLCRLDRGMNRWAREIWRKRGGNKRYWINVCDKDSPYIHSKVLGEYWLFSLFKMSMLSPFFHLL